jgi:hypothetical protein
MEVGWWMLIVIELYFDAVHSRNDRHLRYLCRALERSGRKPALC